MKLPKHTCPMIDKVIKQINEAYKYADDHKFTSESDVYDILKQLEYIASELYDLEDVMEDIRSANDQLRTAAEHYRGKYEEAEIIISDLQDELNNTTT